MEQNLNETMEVVEAVEELVETVEEVPAKGKIGWYIAGGAVIITVAGIVVKKIALPKIKAKLEARKAKKAEKEAVVEE